MVQHWIGVFMLQLCDCIWFYVCVCVTVCACVSVYIEYLSVYVCLMSLVHTSVWFGACILCLRLCVWSFIERNRVWGRRMWNWIMSFSVGRGAYIYMCVCMWGMGRTPTVCMFTKYVWAGLWRVCVCVCVKESERQHFITPICVRINSVCMWVHVHVLVCLRLRFQNARVCVFRSYMCVYECNY